MYTETSEKAIDDNGFFSCFGISGQIDAFAVLKIDCCESLFKNKGDN